MNRKEAAQKALVAADQCLKAKGYISMLDVLLTMGKVTREDHQRWRFRQIPYLEKVVQGNLKQFDAILRTVRNNSLIGGLKPSQTAYMSWGKAGGSRYALPKREIGFWRRLTIRIIWPPM